MSDHLCVCQMFFVLPSYREGFGVVLMEAGALDIPCITTDISGCNEIIQDGVNGRVIPRVMKIFCMKQ